MNTSTPARMPHGIYKGLTADQLPTKTMLMVLGREDMTKYRKLIISCAQELEQRLIDGRFLTDILDIPTDRTVYLPEMKGCLVCATHEKNTPSKLTQI